MSTGLRLPRSEEHTSELQSRENLVCRLLLEKKKTHHNHYLRSSLFLQCYANHRDLHSFPTRRSSDLQKRIASCLSSLDALIDAETQKLETLKIHKKGLMQQLFPSQEEVGV